MSRYFWPYIVDVHGSEPFLQRQCKTAYTPESAELIKQLNLAAITVLNNDEDILPIPSDLENSSIALLELPGKASLNQLKEGIENYTAITPF